MKASVVCLLFASLLVIVLPRGNEGHKLKKNLNEEAQQRKNFKEYDADNNGYISLHEFRITGTNKGLGEYIDFLMGVHDQNNDEQLSFEETDNIGTIFRKKITVQLIYGSSNISVEFQDFYKPSNEEVEF